MIALDGAIIEKTSFAGRLATQGKRLFWWALGVFVGATALCVVEPPRQWSSAWSGVLMALAVALGSGGGIAALELRDWRFRLPLLVAAVGAAVFWVAG